MQESGSILLVSCYELGHQPFALGSAAAFLRRAGYSPALLDLAVTEFDEGRIAQARFVGVSVPMLTALRLGIRAAQRIRELNPSCHICFYGLYASLNADYLLEQWADSVIGGEFETPLLALIDALFELEGTHAGRVEAEGVSFRDRRSEPYLKRLSFAAPDYRGLPILENYAHLVHKGAHRLSGYVEASRGCLHRCLHCPITPVYDGRFFVVREDVVLESIRDLIRAGATHITFGDPDFLNGPGHSIRLVRAMHQEFPELTFDFTAKVEHLLKRRSLLSEFAQAGCLFVTSAFEAISDVVLRNLNKGHLRADIDEVLKIFRRTGIALRPTWVPFTPWTSLHNYIEMLEYIYAEELVQNIDAVQYTIRLLVPPGSALLQHRELTPFLGSLNQASFAYDWVHPDSRMDELQARVNLSVEQMTTVGESTFCIFKRVRELAYDACGARPPAVDLRSDEQCKSPRLTESWFCCAEPTSLQLGLVNQSQRARERQAVVPIDPTRNHPLPIFRAQGSTK